MLGDTTAPDTTRGHPEPVAPFPRVQAAMLDRLFGGAGAYAAGPDPDESALDVLLRLAKKPRKPPRRISPVMVRLLARRHGWTLRNVARAARAETRRQTGIWTPIAVRRASFGGEPRPRARRLRMRSSRAPPGDDPDPEPDLAPLRDVSYRLNVALEWHQDGADDDAWAVVVDLLDDVDRLLRRSGRNAA